MIFEYSIKSSKIKQKLNNFIEKHSNPIENQYWAF